MSGSHAFAYVRDDRRSFFLGEWHAAGRRPATVVVHITRDREQAGRWRDELAAGMLPAPNGDGPPAAAPS